VAARHALPYLLDEIDECERYREKRFKRLQSRISRASRAVVTESERRALIALGLNEKFIEEYSRRALAS
jgi:hypothetical protein